MTGGADSGEPGADAPATATNDGSRFDRLPATAAERRVDGRAARAEIVDWWVDRFGVDPFEGHTLWEKGKGKIWAYAGKAPDPVTVEALGLPVMRTRQRFWKPTTDAVQRFGGTATRNVIHLDGAGATRFVAGEDQPIERDGEPGYCIVTHDCGGSAAVIGVGLWVDGELQSTVPKHRRRSFDERDG
jgi:NOL1/NOP2/fmu family ribosome biogenesis protein